MSRERWTDDLERVRHKRKSVRGMNRQRSRSAQDRAQYRQPSQPPCGLLASQRLNGPADNSKSSSLSCHQTASVPDSNGKTPAIIAQFGSLPKGNGQCMPQSTDKDKNALNLLIDQTYFKTFACSTSFTGPAQVVPAPDYASGAKDWASTDFSLQLSISLAQWQQWSQDQKENDKAKKGFKASLPAR